MRLRPDDWLRVPGVGGAGAIWGLGLARLVAEAGFWPPLFRSVPAVVGVAIISSAIVVALCLWARRPSYPHRPTPPPPHTPILPHSQAVPLALPFLYVTGLIPHPLAGCVLLIGGAALALLVAWGDRNRWLPPAVLGLAAFALYLRTLLPSVGQADTFEFQVIVPRLAVAHPTGYPLYVLLGKLFTLLPLGPALSGAGGNVAWRVNLASAVFGTLAVLVLYALVRRLAAHWLPAFLAALAFAFSSTFWSQAVIAEVYTLHNLLVAAILWLLLGHVQTSEVSGRPPRSAARRWQALFLLIGLSLTNHLTAALLLPAVALALLLDRPRLRPREWLVAGGLLLLGLSVYLFIPLRWPALNQGESMTLRGFLAHVTGGQFHAALRLDGWRNSVRWGIVGRTMREPFGWGGLALAAVGAVGLAVRRKRALALTGVTFLAFVLYGLDYTVPDVSVFLLPAHLILALWIGAGVATLGRLTLRLRSFPSTGSRWSFSISHCSFLICHISFVILFALLPLSRIWLNLPLVDRSQDQGGIAWGRYVLSLPLAPGSAVLADVEKFAPLYYLQQIEHVRPDLDLLVFGSEELYRAELAARLAAGQTVYLARYLPDLGGRHLRSLGPLVEVGAGGERIDEGEEGKAGVRFGEEIRLLDAEVGADPLGRALVHLTLRWQAGARVSGDFLVRLRLVDSGGQVRWESDGARPVGGLYPTNAWPVGAVISDYHAVPLPPWLPRGEHTLDVGLFPPFGDMGLDVGDGATAWLALDTVDVTPPSAPLPRLPHERRCSFAGGGWLTGYNLPAEAPAGAPVVADLSWQRMETDEVVHLSWVDARGREVEAAICRLVGGARRSRHVVAAPQDPGDYVLAVGLVGEPARCGWLARPADACPLATVQVVAAQEGLANFADLVLLMDAEVGRADARPGETVPVALRWRALRAMDEDYTVFVHLVGPDGRLHGQVDMWPVQGSYPTSRWTPGEKVSDPYEVWLDPGAPPGPYRVEVGWYLLATMQRLQIVDASGRPVGDSFVFGQLSVAD